SKASRAKRTLQKKATLKEERKLAALASGHDWESDDSDEEILCMFELIVEYNMQQSSKEPPLPALLEDEKQFCLIKDLCHAFTSLGRYNEALEILGHTLKLSHRILPTEKKEELRCLGAKMAFKVNDPYYAFDYVRYIVLHNPQNIAAWNCYYKLVSRLENRLSKHCKFLHHMRVARKDLVPPMIITGNQFTAISQHQVAAREYLEAYKLMPENPLVNLCAGTSLINLALGFRLQNRHQCIAQGLAFLYNNLRLCGDDNQEALYNIARACQHVGLVSLAASYYEKVLAIRERSYPFPEVVEKDQKIVQNHKSVNCDLRSEAAFNLHLIYKSSGAIDLARQLLKDHCTL
ncbi:hypothetical protein V2J09_010706, partial [Rumex salicifolius]